MKTVADYINPYSFDILSTYESYKIYLFIEMFGFEEILYELARAGVKIELSQPQKALFNLCNHGDLFEFDGLPQLIVHPYISKFVPLRKQDYERFAIGML